MFPHPVVPQMTIITEKLLAGWWSKMAAEAAPHTLMTSRDSFTRLEVTWPKQQKPAAAIESCTEAPGMDDPGGPGRPVLTAHDDHYL